MVVNTQDLKSCVPQKEHAGSMPVAGTNKMGATLKWSGAGL